MAEEPQDAAEMRLSRLLALILETAVDTLGYDAATITARHQGSLSTVAATDPRLVLLDEVQYQSGRGPCLTVLDAHDPVAWTERDGDAAWQAFEVLTKMSKDSNVKLRDVAQRLVEARSTGAAEH